MEITPAVNEITFEFTGTALSFLQGDVEVFMEVDWLTLEPKYSAELGILATCA